jgi:hypothetical protein
LSHDVSITFQGTQSGGKPIERADLNVTVYLQNGQKPILHQYREAWRPGETITFNLPAGGDIERVELSGTCQVAGQGRELTGAWVTAAKAHP